MQKPDKINDRTPEEIKQGLEHCVLYGICCECTYAKEHFCGNKLFADYSALIQHLEAERDQYRRERDAAVELLHGFCEACANKGKHEICYECSRRLPFEPDDKNDHWQWRGVEEVE